MFKSLKEIIDPSKAAFLVSDGIDKVHSFILKNPNRSIHFWNGLALNIILRIHKDGPEDKIFEKTDKLKDIMGFLGSKNVDLHQEQLNFYIIGWNGKVKNNMLTTKSFKSSVVEAMNGLITKTKYQNNVDQMLYAFFMGYDLDTLSNVKKKEERYRPLDIIEEVLLAKEVESLKKSLPQKAKSVIKIL